MFVPWARPDGFMSILTDVKPNDLNSNIDLLIEREKQSKHADSFATEILFSEINVSRFDTWSFRNERVLLTYCVLYLMWFRILILIYCTVQDRCDVM